MSALVPAARPRLKTERVHEILDGDNPARLVVPSAKYPVRLLAIRGYYRDSMGRPGQNDRGIYDDAIIVDTPSASVTFNANVDPSVHREGIAVLNPGLWWYKVGIHGLSKPKAKQYKAFVQAAEVTVTRDAEGSDTGYFGINIHRGGSSGTSSLGCQTIPPEQWDAFFALVTSELARAGQTRVPYLLTDMIP